MSSVELLAPVGRSSAASLNLLSSASSTTLPSESSFVSSHTISCSNSAIQMAASNSSQIVSDTASANPSQANTSNSMQKAISSIESLKVNLVIPLMSPDKLYPTPSMKDNLPFDVEFDLRLTGCQLIQTAGRLLKFPQVKNLTT
jgi:hypothetical protein